MEGGPPCFRPGSTCPVLLWCLLGRFRFLNTGLLPSLAQLSSCLLLNYSVPCHRSTTPKSEDFGLASFPFARRYLGNRVCFLFLRVLRCFSSPRFLLFTYVFSKGYMRITTCEFPHSEISGSMDMCSSPELFAACHVLLRLPVPRHSPCALFHLTFRLLFLTRESKFLLLSFDFSKKFSGFLGDNRRLYPIS